MSIQCRASGSWDLQTDLNGVPKVTAEEVKTLLMNSHGASIDSLPVPESI